MAERLGNSVNALSAEADTAMNAYILEAITALEGALNPYLTVSKYEG